MISLFRLGLERDYVTTAESDALISFTGIIVRVVQTALYLF